MIAAPYPRRWQKAYARGPLGGLLTPTMQDVRPWLTMTAAAFAVRSAFPRRVADTWTPLGYCLREEAPDDWQRLQDVQAVMDETWRECMRVYREGLGL